MCSVAQHGIAQHGTAFVEVSTPNQLGWVICTTPGALSLAAPMSCTFPALLPWGHGYYGSTGTCLGSDPPEHSPHTPKTRGCPAAMPLAPLPSMPQGETSMPWPLSTALPSPTKQVLSFTFGWCWGCKRSPVGAQPHCKPLQPHCRPLYCLLWAGCRQTPLSPCPHSHHRWHVGTMSALG